MMRTYVVCIVVFLSVFGSKVSVAGDVSEITMKVFDLFTGESLEGVFVDVGEHGSGITDQNGEVVISVGNKGQIAFYARKDGYMVRHSYVYLYRSSHVELNLSLIDLNYQHFNLHAYKKVVFDSKEDVLYKSTRWINDPLFYVDLTPDKLTGEVLSMQQVELLRSRIDALAEKFTNGVVTGARFDYGIKPPKNNVIVIKLESCLSSPGGVGGGWMHKGQLKYQNIYFKTPHASEDQFLVAHELGHAVGLSRVNGVPSIMTGHSRFYDDEPLLPDTVQTDYDLAFSKALYSRPPSSRIEKNLDLAVEYDSPDYPYLCLSSVCKQHGELGAYKRYIQTL
jgi:hypothetical protein